MKYLGTLIIIFLLIFDLSRTNHSRTLLPIQGLPVVYELYGPQPQENLTLTQGFGGTWSYPGACTSCSFKSFLFGDGLPQARRVILGVFWRANSANNRFRLIHADNGPSNITEIISFNSTSPLNPNAQSFDITTQFNALVNAGVSKNIGYQFMGDGTPLVLYEAQLYIEWDTTGFSGIPGPPGPPGPSLTQTQFNQMLKTGVNTVTP